MDSKKMRKRPALVVLSALIGLGLAAGSATGAPAVSAPVVAASQSGDYVTRATLANGLRVVIVRQQLAPVVTTQITYLAGSYDTPEGYPGTAHALEHMMFRGDKGLSSAQLFEMAGKMGSGYNAFTTDDATQYFFVAPSQYLDTLLHIGAIRMRSAELTQKSWGLEKGAIEQEVSGDISNPDFLAFEQLESILYSGTGYAQDALGTRPSFDRTTSKILRKFYDDWYQPNNAILVIAGDVDPAATLTKVKQLFGSIPEGVVPQRAPIKLEGFKPVTIAKTTPDPTGSVWFAFRMPGQRSKDSAAMQVLMDVLSNPRSAFQELAAHGQVLSTDVQPQPFEYGGIGIVQVGFPKGGSSKQAEGYLDGVISSLLKNGVPADLVEAAKRQESAQFEFNKNSSVTLASAWSQALAWQGLNSPQEALDEILAVTPQDVDRVAREYLKPDQRLTVVMTPSENGKRPPNSVGFGGTESFAGSTKMTTPLPDWAAKQLANLQIPHWTLDPVKMQLSNGLTLIVQPTDVSKTITVVGEVDNNQSLQAPEGRMGVADVLGSMFSYGTTTLDRTAFHRALDEISATESAGTSFKLAVPTENFDRGMQLLADNELHPALPQNAFEVQQKTLARTLTGELQSPPYIAFKTFFKKIYPAGDPGARQATPETVNSLTLTDVKAYFDKVYRPDMTTIVVVGDVTPQDAKAEVEKYFGAWKASGPKPEVILKPVPLNPASYVNVPNQFASQDQVLMGEILPGIDVHNPARYALELGNGVLGGNGFASRLMTDIRVRHGYAYGAASGMEVKRSRGFIFLEYGSDPDKVKPVNELVYKNIDEMRNEPVKPSELLNAKQAEIRSIPLEVSSVDSVAQGLLDWSINGEPLDQPIVAAKYYLTMTPAQVQEAFRRYVSPANLAQVVQGPAPKKH